MGVCKSLILLGILVLYPVRPLPLHLPIGKHLDRENGKGMVYPKSFSAAVNISHHDKDF